MVSTGRPEGGPRVLVVDDEAPARTELVWLLEQDHRLGPIQSVSGSTAALSHLHHQPVDLLISDISMPGLSGMELVAALEALPHPPVVIFVTAHDEHAVDAFALNATDYVMKPVRAARLTQALDKALSTLALRRTAPAEQPPEETIPVELGGVTKFIPRSQITHVSAQGDYARLHTPTGSHLIRIPLATLEEQWGPAGFIRIHRSTLVASAHINEIRNQGGRRVVVIGETELQVSRRHARDLRALMHLGEGG